MTAARVVRVARLPLGHIVADVLQGEGGVQLVLRLDAPGLQARNLVNFFCGTDVNPGLPAELRALADQLEAVCDAGRRAGRRGFCG